MSPPAEDVPARTPEAQHAWQRLRGRFRDGRDQWTERELSELRFVRWLVQSGRLVDDGGPVANNARGSAR